MRAQTRLPAALLTLVLAILACDLPIPPISFPTQIVGTAVPPASPDPNRVGTAVAQTLTAAAPGREVTTVPAATAVSPTPEGAGSLLPHALYYIAPDSAGMTQIFRLEPDGKTSRQLTSEAGSVSDYDVSPVDSGVAYVAKLLHINKDASERVVLVEGGEVDLNNPFLSTVSSPVFSRDGRTLAYGYKGLQFYSFTTGESRLAIENQVDEVGGGLMVPRELYSPESYSPDGTKLLVTLSYYEGASSAIYYPATSSLVRLTGGEGALICCDEVEWSADSSGLYSASATAGMFSPGLWRIDAATGEVTTLIPGDAGGGMFNAAREAYLAPDSQLYFFFGTVSSSEGMFNRASQQPVRSAPDGVTDRTTLSTEDFSLLNEALWAPDASFAVTVTAPAQEIYQGGQAEVLYFDNRQRVVLARFAQQLKWGP
jgi:Tol biopolymer transport system component